MNVKEIFTPKRIFFILLFVILAFIGDRINFSALVGAEKQYFTFFQFFGPITGAFLGPIFGAITVLFTEILNYIVLGKTFDVINIIRLFPMIFAAIYFAVASKTFTEKINASKALSVIVPLTAITVFILHPIGREVWFFSLYWLIPIIALFFAKNLFIRSLGTTFTAHAVGSALWIYTVPMTAQQWLALIPIVAFERTMFALGIALSFIVTTNVLARIDVIAKASELNIDFNYVLGKKKLSLMKTKA